MDLEHCIELRTGYKEVHCLLAEQNLCSNTRSNLYTRKAVSGYLHRRQLFSCRRNVLLITQVDRHSKTRRSPISSGTQKVKPLDGKVSKGNRLNRHHSSKFLRQIQPWHRKDRTTGKFGANGDEPASYQSPATETNPLIPRNLHMLKLSTNWIKGKPNSHQHPPPGP